MPTPTLIDLSHTIAQGLVTYRGLPPPIICDYLSREESRQYYEDGTQFQIGRIDMVTNTGTYVDCPFHRYAHGKDLSEVSLEAFAELEAVTVQAVGATAIDETYFANVALHRKAVLVHTGWAKRWNTEQYYEHHPYLTASAAAYLKANAVRLVGIDSHNIDDTRGRSRPVHTLLLGAGILIVEHLCNLHRLPGNGYFFSAVPPKFRGAGTFPVRAFARLP